MKNKKSGLVVRTGVKSGYGHSNHNRILLS